jgi:hypothetical protein
MMTRILAVAAAIFAAVAVHFYAQNGELRGQLSDAQASAVTRARHLTAESMDGQGAEIRRVLTWLDAFYKSPDGLQRPQGLWIQDHPDYEGISAWVFDVYVRSRLNGSSEAEAQAQVENAIKGSDEWRMKHPNKS